jgi:hypothetical protein
MRKEIISKSVYRFLQTGQQRKTKAVKNISQTLQEPQI